MRNRTIVSKISAVLTLLLMLGGFSAASAQASGPAAGTVTSSDGCAAHTIATAGGSSAVYYAPDPNDIVLGPIIYAGSSFNVCTAVTVNGWTAFEITVPGTVLYVPAGVFIGYGVPGSPTTTTVAAVPTTTPEPTSLPVLTSSLQAGGTGSLPVGTGTFGTCATFTYRPVVSTSVVYFAARPDAVTNVTINAGSQFAVCTDSNINGWTAFQITIPGTILYVPTGTFG